MRLIGLHGRLRSGKDTAYEEIRRAARDQGLKASRKAFADPMKMSMLRSLGFNPERGIDDAIKLMNLIKETGRISVSWVDPRWPNKAQSNTITGREWVQHYGTEAHRSDDMGSQFGTDFWVDNLLPTNDTSDLWWENFPKGTDVAVVTDVRFANEAQRVLDLGGEVWWIDSEQRLGPNNEYHSSEQKLPARYITKTIDNNGSIEEFEENVRKAYNV